MVFMSLGVPVHSDISLLNCNKKQLEVCVKRPVLPQFASWIRGYNVVFGPVIKINVQA